MTRTTRQPIPANWDQDLFAEYHMINYVEADMWCYRTPRYKLVRDEYNEGRDEFFDLEDDLGESVNLINTLRPHVERPPVDSGQLGDIKRSADTAPRDRP